MKEKLLKKGKNMAKSGVFHNWLIINTLVNYPKIVPKMFGLLVVFSYLCNISIIKPADVWVNRLKL